MNNRIQLILIALLFAFSFSPFMFATYNFVQNGSFETGSLDFWDHSGSHDNWLVTTTDTDFLNETDGSFFAYNSFEHFTSARDALLCTQDQVLEAGKYYNISFDWGSEEQNDLNTRQSELYVCAGACSFGEGTGDTNVNKLIEDETPANNLMQNAVKQLIPSSDSLLCFYIRDDGGGTAFKDEAWALDNIKIEENATVTFTTTEPDQPLNILTPFTISTIAKDSLNANVLTNSDINVQINFNGAGYTNMTYSAGSWSYNNSGLGIGSYPYTIQASGTGYLTSTSLTDYIEVSIPYTDNIIITDISNINHYVGKDYVNLSPSDNYGEFVFKVENVNEIGIAFDVNYSIQNELNNSNRRYFVYTSIDGEAYTFDETLTFGDSSYNPIQKFYNSTRNAFDYKFSATIGAGQTKYYKLIYSQTPKNWPVIGNSLEWININPSQIVSEDNGNHSFDLFQNSFNTPILSYTKEEFPDLTSSDLTTGFYLIFNARAENSLDLNIGYRIGSIDTTEAVTINSDWNTYAVLIDPSDNNSHLVIKSGDTTESRVYLSDFSIVPASYFNQRLELGNTETIVRGGVSYETIEELKNFSVQTSFYDRDNNLSRMYVQVLLDSNIIKTYEYILNDDSLGIDETYYFSEDLSGVIDYSGASRNGLTLNPLKDLTIKAILVNSDDQNVSEQHKTIKLLQYPYYQTDFALRVLPVNKKVSDNPSFELSFNQKDTKALIGFDVYISTTQNKSDSLYNTTIYANDLGCATLLTCEKTVKLDEFSYPAEDNYFIIIEAILTTEAQEGTNPLTRLVTNLSTTYYAFETARMLQVFERRNLQYKNTENIPLVFQARTDSLENLQKDYVVWLGIDINDNGNYTTIDLNFTPQKFIYDKETGYNYWLWNGLLYDENSSLIPDGNALRFRAYVSPVTEKTSIPKAYGLVNKCQIYPTDWNFNEAGLLMNWISFNAFDDAFFGCLGRSEKVVLYDDVNAVQIIMDNSYVPSANQNHSVLCYREDNDIQFKQELSDEFVCAVLYLKDEEQIDGFKVYLGNGYSDYALTGDEAQYIAFDIDQTQIIFNDVALTRKALELQQDSKINTIGELISAGLNQILPYGQGIVDISQDIFVINSNSDINLSYQVDPTLIKGLFFFKIKNLNVLNKYDYLEAYPELEEVPTKYLRGFLNSKGVDYTFKKATISIYSSDFVPYKTFTTDSTLVIDEAPGQRKNNLNDSNSPNTIQPATLKFDFIVDMFSANRTKASRALVPIYFTYVIPSQFSFGGFFAFGEDLLKDPFGTLAKNWFILAMIVLIGLVFSAIYANIKGGNNITINNRPKGD